VRPERVNKWPNSTTDMLLFKGNVSGKTCRINQNTHFILTKFFLYEIIWKDVLESDKSHVRIKRGPETYSFHEYRHTLTIYYAYCFIMY